MNCKIDEQTLMQWYLGEMSELEHRKIQKHLATCIACRSYIEELTLLNEAWTNEPWQPSQTFTDQVLDRIEAEIDEKLIENQGNQEAFEAKETVVYNVNNKTLDFIHYITAVAATFLLVYLGGFEQMMGIMGEFPDKIHEVNDTIHQATDSGIGWIEGIHYYIQGLLQQMKI